MTDGRTPRAGDDSGTPRAQGDGSANAALVEPYLDLVDTPFGLPGSRLLVRRRADGLVLHTAEYERPLDACVVLEALTVRGVDGVPLPVTRIAVDHVRLGQGPGAVLLTFAGPDALSLAPEHDTDWSLELAPVGAPTGEGGWEPGLPSARRARLRAGPSGSLSVTDGRWRWTGSGPVVLTVGDDDVPLDAGPHRAATTATWQEWMARAPEVDPDLRAVVALCWWVLGLNTVRLHGDGRPTVVVPSVLGYVGLWQWDAYFIARGLRHGAPELAAEQLEVAFGHQGADGQLPDVVHDDGVLASSLDLPEADLVALRRAGSAAVDGDVVPLTKPPLAAWAVRALLDAGAPLDVDVAMGAVLRSQRWWFAHSDTDGDGLPEYAHPYSSGLDDSPVFDGDLPVTTPDLLTYLVLQDRELAGWARARGDDVVARECQERAESTRRGLLDLWDPALGRYVPRSPSGPVPAETVVGLLPLLLADLPADHRAALLACLDDPRRFAAPWGVPTVAHRDPAYEPDRMWRGPTWLNMTALLVEGLRAGGDADRATAMARTALALVEQAGGPWEYLDPGTARPGRRAVSCFSWSAALVVDLAVGLRATR
jgi:hypothetical protein